MVKSACERPAARGRSLCQGDCAAIARTLVAEGLVEAISDETVRRILRHHKLKPWRHHLWLSAKHPRDATFAPQVQERVDFYTRPLEPWEIVAAERLAAVLEAYALIQHRRPTRGLAAFLHREEQVAQAQQRLSALIQRLLAEGAASGAVRDDVAPEELARYCLHALTAAGSLPSEAAVHRLVAVTLAGLRPPR